MPGREPGALDKAQHAAATQKRPLKLYSAKERTRNLNVWITWLHTTDRLNTSSCQMKC